MATKSDLLRFVEWVAERAAEEVPHASGDARSLLDAMAEDARKLLASENEVRLAWTKVTAGRYVADVIGCRFEVRAASDRRSWAVIVDNVVLHGVTEGLDFSMAKKRAVEAAQRIAQRGGA